jgi:hypothetical protein
VSVSSRQPQAAAAAAALLPQHSCPYCACQTALGCYSKHGTNSSSFVLQTLSGSPWPLKGSVPSSQTPVCLVSVQRGPWAVPLHSCHHAQSQGLPDFDGRYKSVMNPFCSPPAANLLLLLLLIHHVVHAQCTPSSQVVRPPQPSGSRPPSH